MRQAQLIMNVTPDYKYFLLFCGLFQGKRNAAKSWPEFEECFLSLVQADGENGPKRLLQTIAWFYVKRCPDQQKYINALFRTLYDQNFLEQEMLVGWYQGKVRSDKGCVMYDKKVEKQFKSLLKDFIDWLTADYDAEEYDEEAPQEEAPAQEVAPVPVVVKEESEHERQQRELIEEQQRKLKDQLAGIKTEPAAADAAKEESKVEPAEKKIDATAVEVEEEFDVDDI